MKRIRPFWCVCQTCGKEFEPLKWKGYVQKYCDRGCANRARPRKFWTDKHGYPQMTIGGKGYPVHRHVMEQKLGRKLRPGETVHHKDGDRSNYAVGNLEVWSSRHGRGQRLTDIAATCAGDHTQAALSLGG